MATPDPTATTLIHELRNALVPLDFKLRRGTATFEDVAQVVARLLTFADDLQAAEREAAKIASLEHEVADLRSRLAQRKTTMDKAYDQLGDIIGDLRHGSALCVMLSEIRASLD